MKRKYYTINIIAERIGRSKVAVLKRIQHGDMKAENIGGVWFIERQEFKKFCQRFNFTPSKQ